MSRLTCTHTLAPPWGRAASGRQPAPGECGTPRAHMRTLGLCPGCSGDLCFPLPLWSPDQLASPSLWAPALQSKAAEEAEGHPPSWKPVWGLYSAARLWSQGTEQPGDSGAPPLLAHSLILGCHTVGRWLGSNLLLTKRDTLGKLSKLFVPLLSYLQKGGNNSYLLREAYLPLRLRWIKVQGGTQ